MNHDVSISAIVPAYNSAEYLPATLEAILGQSHPPLEVIVVDDGSIDTTGAVAARYTPRVRCVRTENRGVQAARNLGIAEARGNWIALCDADDLWLPEHLAAHAALIAAEPSVRFSFGNFRTLRDGVLLPGDKFATAPNGFWDAPGRRTVPRGWVFEQPIAGRTFRFHPIFPSACVIAREVITRAGGFNTQMRGLSNEDGEFILRCLYDSVVGTVVEPLVVIRRHGRNSSGDRVRNMMDEVRSLRFVSAHHAEAAPFVDVIDAEIRRRGIDALDAAFAAQDHRTVRMIRQEIGIPLGDPKMLLKLAVAALPDSLGRPMNRILQRLVSGRVATGEDRRA